MVQELVAQNSQYNDTDTTPDHLGFAFAFTENTKQRVHTDCYQHKVPDIERHRLNTRYYRINELIGEIGQRQTVLVEGHPEEDHYSKHQTQRYDTFLGLLRTQLIYFLTTRGSLFSRVLYVLEPRTASIVNSNTQYQRRTRNGERKVITVVHAYAQRLMCPCHDLHSGRRREHSTYVNRHVEQRESRITAVCVCRIVIQITYHHL